MPTPGPESTKSFAQLQSHEVSVNWLSFMPPSVPSIYLPAHHQRNVPTSLSTGLTNCAGAASQDASKRKQVQAAIAAASQKPLPRPPQLEDSQKPLPRSSRKRPTSLALSTTNGRSVLPSPLLKQRICSARSSSDTSATLQIAAPDRREPLPPTPTTPIASLVMGNAHSGSPSPDDDASMRSVVHVRRDSRLLSRKGSSNLFKRIDSRSPLPRDVTASVMSMIHRDGAKKDHSGLEDDGLVGVTVDHFSKRPDPHGNHYPGRPSGTRMVPSTTTIMITESRTNLPPSASEPVQDFSAPDSEPNDHTTDFPCIEEPQPDPEKELLENISPTIPAPSPLPEDSPHKYGLRDSANTPPVPHATQDIQLPKARRKSSGLEIFKVRSRLTIVIAGGITLTADTGGSDSATSSILPQWAEYSSSSRRVCCSDSHRYNE